MEDASIKVFLKKYFAKNKGSALIVLGVFLLSLISHFLPALKGREDEAARPESLDSLAPEGFVLIPVEIANGEDIAHIIGSHGVADLYSYSPGAGLPKDLAARSLKIISPETEDGSFVVLAPEKEAPYLFQHGSPFYAVIQNPGKKGSRIYKKKNRKKLTLIEEDF